MKASFDLECSTRVEHGKRLVKAKYRYVTYDLGPLSAPGTPNQYLYRLHDSDVRDTIELPVRDFNVMTSANLASVRGQAGFLNVRRQHESTP